MIDDFSAVERLARTRILEAAWASLSAKENFWRMAQTGPRFSEDEGVRTLACLGRYFTDRGRGVLTLGVSGFDWEAEIVLRTIYECVAKMFLLALVDDAERITLIEEFWELAQQASDRKIARKAAFAEEVFPEDTASRDIFKVLYDQRIVRNSHNLTKAERRRIARKWSFSEIIERLAQMKIGDRQMQEVRSLLHMYGMASHLAHADHVAMELMFDRALRPVDELVVLRIAHIARIATDMSSLGAFCAHLAAPLVGVVREGLLEIDAANSNLMKIASEYSVAFEDSERSFYDQMLDRGENMPPR